MINQKPSNDSDKPTLLQAIKLIRADCVIEIPFRAIMRTRRVAATLLEGRARSRPASPLIPTPVVPDPTATWKPALVSA
jgi:hypothetical protein